MYTPFKDPGGGTLDTCPKPELCVSQEDRFQCVVSRTEEEERSQRYTHHRHLARFPPPRVSKSIFTPLFFHLHSHSIAPEIAAALLLLVTNAFLLCGSVRGCRRRLCSTYSSTPREIFERNAAPFVGGAREHVARQRCARSVRHTLFAHDCALNVHMRIAVLCVTAHVKNAALVELRRDVTSRVTH